MLLHLTSFTYLLLITKAVQVLINTSATMSNYIKRFYQETGADENADKTLLFEQEIIVRHVLKGLSKYKIQCLLRFLSVTEISLL